MALSRSVPKRLGIVLVAASSAVALAAVVPTGANAASPRHTLSGSRPNWVAKAHKVGDTASSAKVSFGVLLSMRNQKEAEAQIQSLSDPSSASYGKYLSNKEFNARYAPTAASVSAVRSWLQGQGFAVQKTLPSGMYIELTGTAQQVEKTFGTSLAQYRYQGQTVRSNATALSLPSSAPAAVTSGIEGVVGVDQGSSLKKPADTLPGPPPGSRTGVHTQPCSDYAGQKIATDKPVGSDGTHKPYEVCGYTPKQLQSAYGMSSLVNHGLDGRGITVAITDAFAAPTIAADAAKYNQFYGLPAFKAGQFSQITPPADGYDLVDECGGSGWYGEETLDVEAVHTMAPGAKIVYVGAKDCSTGLDDAWAETIDNHVADIVTNSWGDGVDTVADLGQDYIDFYQYYSMEAALTGITVNFSTGDDGDQSSGGTQPQNTSLSFPSDLPYVTGVGGTSIFVGKSGQRVAEYGWQNAYAQLSSDGKSWGPMVYSSGGGGGTSQLFPQPYYQRGVVPNSVATVHGGAPMRATPDIAMEGDPNSGLIVGETQSFPDGTYWDRYRIGGTSLSSPLMAGIDAVAGQASGRPIGFANPVYYELNRTSAINDIVAPRSPVQQVRTDFVNGLDGSNGLKFQLAQVDVQTTSLHDTRGWDNETGVGTPNGLRFVAAVAVLSHFRH